MAKECDASTFQVVKWTKPTVSASSAMMLRDTCCVPEFRQMRRLLLSADNRLLTVVHNNIIRGLVSNALHLGYTWDAVCQDSSLSSFCEVPPGGIAVSGKDVHPRLKPTTLQRHVIHHPWVDLIPSAQFRDNILRATLTWADGEKDFETDLCKDLTGAGELQLTCARPGLMVWGDPCDSTSWEMSNEFACKWPEIVYGCWDMIDSTNYWRKSRGEPLLRLDACRTPRQNPALGQALPGFALQVSSPQ